MHKIKLNLGCGNKYLKGYVNCDILKNVRIDKYVDLNKKRYPFKSNSADEILMDNVLEHLDDITEVLKELHRILKRDGNLKIYVPYGKSDWAFQDPTHKHFFTENSMNYFTKSFSHSYYSEFKFKLNKSELFCETLSIRGFLRNLIPFKSVMKYFLFNMYDGIYFELQPIK